MEANQLKRTVKTKFLMADKISKGAKAGGLLALMAGAFVLKFALESKGNNDGDDDNSDND